MFDLPEPQPLIVTEHRAYRCRCGRCGGETRAPFPEEVTVQYGPRLLAVYLLHYQLLPEDRLAEAMADLFGVRLVAAARMSRSCAERFSGVAEAVCERVKAAPVKHLDGPSGNAGGDKPAFGQDAMAAHRVHRVADLLSRLAQARQPAVGRCGHRRA